MTTYDAPINYDSAINYDGGDTPVIVDSTGGGPTGTGRTHYSRYNAELELRKIYAEIEKADNPQIIEEAFETVSPHIASAYSSTETLPPYYNIDFINLAADIEAVGKLMQLKRQLEEEQEIAIILMLAF